MDERTERSAIEGILKVADRFELSRIEMKEVLNASLEQFDRLAIIPQKRRCPRSEREHLD